MEFTVTLQDADGNVVQPGKCKCGKASDTFIQGKETYVWRCYECLYPGKSTEAKFEYVEYGKEWPEEVKKQ